MEQITSFADLIEKTKNYSIDDVSELVRDLRQSKSQQFFPEFGLKANKPYGNFIFDYTTFRYPYIDQSFAHIAERPKEYILECGLGPQEKIWYEPDQQVFREKILVNNLKFFKNFSPALHKNYLITCTYRNRSKDGRLKHIMQKTYVIRSTDEGIPLAVIGSVTDVSDFNLGNKMIHTIRNVSEGKIGPDDHVDELFSFEGDKEFTTLQKEIIRYAADGLTQDQIAYKLHVSAKTIEYHKTKMFRLSNKKNMSQLIKFAILNGYI